MQYKYFFLLFPQWQDIDYILRRAEEQVYSLTLKFLEQGCYSLSQGEKEELEAVAEIFKIIHHGIETDPALSLKPDLIDSLLDPLKIIDDLYYNFLEIRGERD